MTENRRDLRLYLPVYLIVVLVYLVAGYLSPDFFTWRNNVNLFSRVTPLVLAGLAQTIVTLSGGLDLSIGSIISLCCVIGASMPWVDTPANVFLWAVCPPLAGALMGFINGLIVGLMKFPPFIVTLSTSAIWLGVAIFILPEPGGEVSMAAAEFVGGNLWGVPIPLILFLFFVLACHLLVTRTAMGRAIYAVGGDENIAVQSGIHPARVWLFSYTLGGVLCGFAGAYQSAWMFSADPLVGEPYVMNSIAVTVIGGTALTGGRGGVAGVIGGAYIFYLINNVLNLLAISTFYQYIAKGLILIVALVISSPETLSRIRGLGRKIAGGSVR
ncbi:MAG: ABC transporter permease [Synergistaceae bacterium]|jgi:ribose/xylose/arabinose/galactoside ABC-type transport system permease subunit|nr:ABC transporter permease [Synergistaceae bacterium]